MLNKDRNQEYNHHQQKKKISQKELLNIACQYLKNHDEHENLGLAWANEIKKMRAHQQIHAKKAIHNILYEGQLGTLHRHSVKINESQPYTTPQSSVWSFPSTSPTPTPLSSPQLTTPQVHMEQYHSLDSIENAGAYF